MTKQGLLAFNGRVTSEKQGGHFHVTLDNTLAMLAKVCSNVHYHGICAAPSDCIHMSVLLYDRQRGLMVLRNRLSLKPGSACAQLSPYSLAKPQGDHHAKPSEDNCSPHGCAVLP
jgi:translation initiation factor IF-1